MRDDVALQRKDPGLVPGFFLCLFFRVFVLLPGGGGDTGHKRSFIDASIWQSISA